MISNLKFEQPKPPTENRTVKREQIAAIVDKFLSQKLSEEAKVEQRTAKSEEPKPKATIIHQVVSRKTENERYRSLLILSAKKMLNRLLADGGKIYITDKTIITPSAK